MKFAAFFRNMNLGRVGSPTRLQLEQAFAEAGAAEASSFQVNGTLVFESSSVKAAQVILGAAAGTLSSRVGLQEPCCVRPLHALSRLPWAEVFAAVNPAEVHEFTVSFACGTLGSTLSLPQATERQDAVVLWVAQGNALSISRKIMSGPGSPNMLLERLTGVPFTSRSLGTIQRLLARYA